MRHLYGFSSRFESVIGVRAKLMEKCEDQVLHSVSFDVGYFEGQKYSKVWLYSNDHLKAMYTGEITLWCDGKSDSEQSSVRGKRKRDEPVTSKRQDKEDEVEAVFKANMGIRLM